MRPRTPIQVTVMECKTKSASIWTTVVIPLLAAAGAFFGASLNYKATMFKAEGEQVVARIDATPDVVTHIESIPEHLLIVANLGPVGAASLKASLEEFQFTNSTVGKPVVAGRVKSRTANRPWQFLTNNLPAGNAAEIRLPGLEIGATPNPIRAYRVAVHFFPEYNFKPSSKHTLTNYFLEVDGVAWSAGAAPHLRTNSAYVSEIIRQMETQTR